MKEKLIAFIKSTFSEADGSASATRVLAGATVLSTLVWISYLVVLNHVLPDLTSPSLFVTAGFSGYGVNKLSKAIKKDDDKG